MSKYLDYHAKFLSEGLKNPEPMSLRNPVGLCCAMNYDSALETLFSPTEDEYDWSYRDAWWGTEDESGNDNQAGLYNGFRQTVVLFLAAMNDEL